MRYIYLLSNLVLLKYNFLKHLLYIQGIRVLSNSSLDGLPRLTTLILVGNPLTTIHDTWSPKLKRLDVSDCQLNYLGPDTFYGFPELDELLLSNNPTLVYSTRQGSLVENVSMIKFDQLRFVKFQEFDVDASEIEEIGRVEVQFGQAGPARVPLVDPRTIDPQRDTNTSRSNIREEQAARFPVFEREQARDVDREHVRRVGEASNVGSVG